MPGTTIFGDKSLGPALFVDQPMGADFRLRIAQARPCQRGAGHRGIVDHDQLWPLTAPIPDLADQTIRAPSTTSSAPLM